MAATYYATADTAGDSFTTSQSVSKPSGIATDGTAAVAFALCFWNAAPTVTAPSGSVLLTTVTNGTNTLKLYVMFVGGESSYSFSWSGSEWASLVGVFWEDIDSGQTLASVAYDTATADSSTFASTSVTADSGDALSWFGGSEDYSGSETHTPPTGFTETADDPPYAAAQRTAGTTGTNTASSATISSSQAINSALVAFAQASAGDATFTANVGDATAGGASTSLTGAAAFSTTVGDATAGAASTALTGDGTFTATVGDAVAGGASTSFAGGATLTATVGDATAGGGSVTMTGTGGGAATFTATVGDATAGGGAVSMTGTATFTTAAGDATTAGASTSLTGASTFTASAGDSTAAGSAATFTGTAVFTTTAGDATAGGRTVVMFAGVRTTPDSRTVTVPTEDRTVEVPAGGRTVTVPVGDRTITVPVGDRTIAVPADDRTIAVPAA